LSNTYTTTHRNGGGLGQGQAVYEGMNVLVRRSAKENNFKAVSSAFILNMYTYLFI
jgi:hypothetical protein